MIPIESGRYRPVVGLRRVVLPIGLEGLATRLLQRGANGSDPAASRLLRGLIELPLRLRGLVGFEQLQLSFHEDEYPQGV
jgi:hypothetical protein